MSSNHILTGKTLQGRYRINQTVGGGGQAIVFVGTDTSSGHLRAVKLFEVTFQTPLEVIERFKKESLILVNLPRHDHIVRVYDGGHDENLRILYTVLDFVEGSDLGKLIEAADYQPSSPASDLTLPHTQLTDSETDEGDLDVTAVHATTTLTPSLAVGIIEKVADGLAMVHGENVIHRDVKPSNILIGRDGSIKLTDFGIAQSSNGSHLTQAGKAVGTLLYMSPEQLRPGSRLDGRVDIYALGVTLYACLVGHPPFNHVADHLLQSYIVDVAPQPPSEINTAIPAALESVVLKALAKNPDDRYQTMTEFKQALSELVEAKIVAAYSKDALVDLMAQVIGNLPSMQPTDPKESSLRCPTCGVPLPIDWGTESGACPACDSAVEKPAESSPQFVRERIRETWESEGIFTKPEFGLAIHLYHKSLYKPLFDQWVEKTTAAGPVLEKGTVVSPPTTSAREPELLSVVRELMEAADCLTDPELFDDYNLRLPLRFEAEALAAQARATGYQLLGRYHTINAATVADPVEATRLYTIGKNVLLLAEEQYGLALTAWEKYEEGESAPHIETYYAQPKSECEVGQLWTSEAGLLAEGIVRFPHNQEEAYALFHEAEHIHEKIETNKPLKGANQDVNVAHIYDGYYEMALASLKEHIAAITQIQEETSKELEKTYQEEQRLRLADQKLVAEWMRERSRIALAYYHKLEDLPQKWRRVRLVTPLVGYLLIVLIAFVIPFDVRFWVLLLGLDVLILFPFNLMVKRQLGRHQWDDNLLPMIPAPSQFLLPIADALYTVGHDNKQKNKGSNSPANFARFVARVMALAAPWVPVALLVNFLSDIGVAFAFIGWLLALAFVPSFTGYLIGRYLKQLEDQLGQLESDEEKEQAELNQTIMAERSKLRQERTQQTERACELFAEANQNIEQQRTTIDTQLTVLLARLLHHQPASDFVDLPALETQVLNWREEVDEKYMRWMGLRYQGGVARLVDGQAWQDTRPLDLYLPPTRARQAPLSITTDSDGYIVWGTDGFQRLRRQRLQASSDGRFTADIETSPLSQQINFTFESTDHEWPGDLFTIWVEKNDEVTNG